MDMDKQAVVTAYRRLSGQYDRFFGAVFEQGRDLSVKKMACQPGDRVLEVGVGTGLSLQHYPRGVVVDGIDVSPDMLEHARARLDSEQEKRITLQVMDAQQLAFEDDSFDKVVAMYVASVVPGPEQLIAEMKRVCRPGGDIFIVNHFSRGSGPMAAVERLIEPLSNLIGFRPAFPLQDFLDMAELDVVDQQGVNAFGYWTLLHARNPEQAAADTV